MTVIDCWKAMKFHLRAAHPYKDVQIRSFASLLADELLSNNFSDAREEDENMNLPGVLPGDRAPDVSHHLQSRLIAVEEGEVQGSVSDLSMSDSGGAAMHRMETYAEVLSKDGKRRVGRNRCRLCYKQGKTSYSRFFVSIVVAVSALMVQVVGMKSGCVGHFTRGMHGLMEQASQAVAGPHLREHHSGVFCLSVIPR